jgi:hypothetical protein
MLILKPIAPLALVAGLIASLAAPAPAMAQQAYAYQNVFNDNTGLTLNGLWAVDNTPAVPSGAPASGGNNLNYNDGVDYDNGQSNSGGARTPTINLTNVVSGSMSFWCRYQTEDAGTNYDQRFIRIFNATTGAQLYQGQLAGTAASPLTCPAMNQWHQHTFTSIPAAAFGNQIQVEFFFNTVDAGINNYQGWFIDDFVMIVSDATPPVAISDLDANTPGLSGCTVEWSSPFDDDISGKAASFDLRYSTATITAANFATATQVSGEPVPAAPGTPHTVNITGLNPGTQYYFAIKSTDVAGNTSAISNIATVTTTALPPVGGSATEAAKPPKDRYNACSAGTAGAPVGLMALGALLGFAAAFRSRFKK